MRGDFTRSTFDPAKNFSRVLLLQGRVSVDADFNEAMELQLQHLRALTRALIGPHAGRGNGFDISAATNSRDLVIARGSYFVDGIHVANVAPAIDPLPPPPQFTTQPQFAYGTPAPQIPNTPDDGVLIAYLDVWERFVTYIEDQDRTPQELGQSIREVALGGPDTAGRSRVMWQVRLLPLTGDGVRDLDNETAFERFIEELTRIGEIRSVGDGPHRLGRLKARARRPAEDDLPCAVSPESRYRGPENQLYRVEIHTPGRFAIDPGPGVGPAPTFKWSRENGSVIFPIRTVTGPTVVVEHLGRDERLGLKQGDLVEVVDDDYVLNNRAEPLLEVVSVDAETFTIELSASPASTVGTRPELHPILRRWEGAGTVSRNADPDSEGYLHLEDGVEVQFIEGELRTSDYWMIPARTATGDVEWPGKVGDPVALPPHGIEHSYAPLALVEAPANANLNILASLRRTINRLWT
jgi:hypothetical protein